MTQPLSVERYIKLITKDPLDEAILKKWYRCVRDHAPNGVVRTVNTLDDKGHVKSVALIHQETDQRHCYIIPLTRDLSDAEIQEIIDHFVAENDLEDFDVETNETRLIAKDSEGISLDAAKHLQLCTALAKQQHEDWVRERTGAGWRYGTKFDDDEKTHPLLRPWDQIPDRYRQPNLDWPQKLVQALSRQGYAVVSKKELKRLMAFV